MKVMLLGQILISSITVEMYFLDRQTWYMIACLNILTRFPLGIQTIQTNPTQLLISCFLYQTHQNLTSIQFIQNEYIHQIMLYLQLIFLLTKNTYVIIKNSEDKDNFIAELIDFIKRLDTKSLMNKNGLNRKVQEFANIADHIWFRHSKLINITKHSKTQ